jgi:hypothetical protein
MFCWQFEWNSCALGSELRNVVLLFSKIVVNYDIKISFPKNWKPKPVMFKSFFILAFGVCCKYQYFLNKFVTSCSECM